MLVSLRFLFALSCLLCVCVCMLYVFLCCDSLHLMCVRLCVIGVLLIDFLSVFGSLCVVFSAFSSLVHHAERPAGWSTIQAGRGGVRFVAFVLFGFCGLFVLLSAWQWKGTRFGLTGLC